MANRVATMTKDKSIKAYMCGIDWSCDLPLGANDVKLYTSLSAIKRNRTCIKECGIVEVRVTKVRNVLKGDL